MNPHKLYIIVAKKLKSGLKIAQACHALRQFASEHRHLDEYWYRESNNLVCLHVEDLEGLAGDLEQRGFRISRFHEPDLDGELTAVAVEPAAYRHLSNLQLAS